MNTPRSITLSALFAALSLVVASVPSFAHSAPTRSSVKRNYCTDHFPIIVVPVPSTLSAGDSSTVTVTLDGTATSDTTVTITSSDPSVVTAPSYVTVPSGQSSASLSVLANNHDRLRSSSVTLTAYANGHSATATVTVN